MKLLDSYALFLFSFLCLCSVRTSIIDFYRWWHFPCFPFLHTEILKRGQKDKEIIFSTKLTPCSLNLQASFESSPITGDDTRLTPINKTVHQPLHRMTHSSLRFSLRLTVASCALVEFQSCVFRQWFLVEVVFALKNVSFSGHATGQNYGNTAARLPRVLQIRSAVLAVCTFLRHCPLIILRDAAVTKEWAIPRRVLVIQKSCACVCFFFFF